MKRKIIYLFISLMTLPLLFASCLTSNTEAIEAFDNNDISDVAGVWYRYVTVENANSGREVLKKLELDGITKKIDKETKTITLSVSPSTPIIKSLPADARAALSIKNIGVVVSLPTAARIFPVGNAPKLGINGDWSQPNQYEVVAANGNKAVWTIKMEALNIPLINKYDGNYTMTGTMVDYTSSALTGKYPLNVTLVTQSENSVALLDAASNDYRHQILSNGSDSYYGNFAPVFTFDANDNVVSVTNYFGQPASNGRSAQLDPSGVNKWDAATKTLRVKYWMNQPGDTHRTLFDETFTWKN